MTPDRTARARLVRAWSALAADVVAAAVSHHDLHPWGSGLEGEASSAGKPSSSAGIGVAVDTTCRPSYTGTAGQVQVGVAPRTYDVPLAKVVVEHIVPGLLAANAMEALAPSSLPAGQDHVVVAVPPNFAAGLYIGRIHDPNGASVAPFCIYLDGLH